jgi:hypothetical protein
MKRNFLKSGNRERVDKIEKKASVPAASVKEKSSKRKLSIYDDFEEDEMDESDPKYVKGMKFKR